MREKFVVQLYTVRNEIEKDFPRVLRDLKKMGWAGVQMTVPQQYKAEEIAKIAGELGLVTAGMHFRYDRMINDLPGILREMELFRTKDLILSAVPEPMRNAEGYKEVRKTLNELARKLAPHGYRVIYHNHAFEFETEVEGKNSLEYLIEPAKDNLILAELDTYWLKKGGQDPLSFIRRYANRMPILHVKDMTDDDRQTFAEVGTGSIDFVPILKWCEESGVEWYSVEQDICPGNPMDSLQISLNYLNRLADQFAQGKL